MCESYFYVEKIKNKKDIANQKLAKIGNFYVAFKLINFIFS